MKRFTFKGFDDNSIVPCVRVHFKYKPVPLSQSRDVLLYVNDSHVGMIMRSSFNPSEWYLRIFVWTSYRSRDWVRRTITAKNEEGAKRRSLLELRQVMARYDLADLALETHYA